MVDKFLIVLCETVLATMFILMVLQCVFFLLKLYGAVDWSWMLVFLPLIIVVAISAMSLVVLSGIEAGY